MSISHCVQWLWQIPWPLSHPTFHELSKHLWTPVEKLKQEETQAKGEDGVRCQFYRVLLHFPEAFVWKTGEEPETKGFTVLSIAAIPPNSSMAPAKHETPDFQPKDLQWIEVRLDKGIYAHLFTSVILVRNAILLWLCFSRVYVPLTGHQMVEWHIVSSFTKSKHFQKLLVRERGRWAFWELLIFSIRPFLPCFPSTWLSTPAAVPPESMEQRQPTQLTFWLFFSLQSVYSYLQRGISQPF